SGIGIKLMAVLLRQISKPIANRLQVVALKSDLFKRICMNLSQKVHSTDVKLRMKLLGEKHSLNSTHSTVRPLNEKKAIENAAYLLSEGFIFSIAGSLILFEAYRTRRKELNRRESVSDDIKALQDEINYIKKKLDEHNVEL
ncbi:OPA3 family protein, partial [Ascoidea rubescens DSM 1968]